jgi:hypothetical protein
MNFIANKRIILAVSCDEAKYLFFLVRWSVDVLTKPGPEDQVRWTRTDVIGTAAGVLQVAVYDELVSFYYGEGFQLELFVNLTNARGIVRDRTDV